MRCAFSHTGKEPPLVFNNHSNVLRKEHEKVDKQDEAVFASAESVFVVLKPDPFSCLKRVNDSVLRKIVEGQEGN